MIVKNIQKSLAELYKALLSELRPDWDIKITVEDYNLYKLGFVKEIPCSLSVDISEDEIDKLYNELIDREINVYVSEDLLYKDVKSMSEQEKIEYKELKKLEKEYLKYMPVEGLCCYWLGI